MAAQHAATQPQSAKASIEIVAQIRATASLTRAADKEENK